MNTVLYIHGMGGSAAESAHYQPLFPGCAVTGLAYQTCTPWETGAEIRAAVAALRSADARITLIANSIGAYFSMCAGIDAWIDRAYFISPVVDLEALIRGRMAAAGVTEKELQARGVIPTADGGELSWDYFSWVCAHPPGWRAPTAILYGGRDTLVARETVTAFADAHGASLTVMEDGAHWFHTPAQMAFLDRWLQTH